MIYPQKQRKRNRFYSSDIKIPSGIILCNSEGIILHASKAAENIFGKHLVNSSITSLMKAQDAVIFSKYTANVGKSCGFYTLTRGSRSVSAVHSGFYLGELKINAFVTSSGDPVKLRRLVNSQGFELLDLDKTAELYNDLFFSTYYGESIQSSDIADFYEACASIVSTIARPFSLPVKMQFVPPLSLLNIWLNSSGAPSHYTFAPQNSFQHDIYIDPAMTVVLLSAISSLLSDGNDLSANIRYIESKTAFEISAVYQDKPNIAPSKDIAKTAEQLGLPWFAQFLISSILPLCEYDAYISCFENKVTFTFLTDSNTSVSVRMKQFKDARIPEYIADMCDILL